MKNIQLARQPLIITAFFTVFFSTYISHAEEIEILEPITVTADKEQPTLSGSTVPLNEYQGAATIVSEDTIKERSPLSAIDVLQTVPGVNVTTEDGRGLRPNIGFRGINPDRSREGTLLLIDGTPMQPAIYGDKSAYYSIPVESVESIEVIRGATSVLYGPGNIGGVVNFIPKGPPEPGEQELELSEKLFQGSLLSSYLSFGKTAENGVGARASYLNKIGSTVRDRTGTQVNDAALHFSAPTASEGKLAFRVNYYDEKVETPGGLNVEQYNRDINSSQRNFDEFEGHRGSFDLRVQQPITGELSFEGLTYLNFLQRDWYLADGNDDTATTNTQYLRQFFVAGVEPRLRYNWLTVGTRLHFEQLSDVNRKGTLPSARTGQTTSDTDLDTLALATYAEIAVPVTETLTVTPGVRYEHIDQGRNSGLRQDSELGLIGGDEASKTTKEIVGGVGANQEILKDGNLYGGVYRSFEPPTFSEAVDPLTNTGRDIDAETALTYEVGYRHAFSDYVSTDLTLFWLDFNDKIINEGGTLSNAGETRHKGVEFAMGAKPYERFKLDFVATLLDTEFRNGSNQGNELPMAPDSRLGWGLSYEALENLTFRVDGYFVDSQFNDAKNTVEESEDGGNGELPSYDVWNLRAQYEPSIEALPPVRLVTGVNNLFDEEYRERRQSFLGGIFPGLTRTFYVGFEVKL